MDILTEVDQKPIIAMKRLRIAAAMIDFIVCWASSFIIGFFFGRVYMDNEGVGVHLQGLPAVIALLAWCLLIPINEGLMGQTLGKRALKITVVKLDFTPTNIWISLVRHFFDLVDLIFLLGLIIASINKDKRRLGDLIAGTIVITKGETLPYSKPYR
jgi:uncharacterized RDD family membrane protein YckC